MTYKEYTYSGGEMIELTCDDCGATSRKPKDNQGKYALFREGWIMNGDRHRCKNCRENIERVRK